MKAFRKKKTKNPAVLDRDFIVVDSEKSGPGASLQTQVKKLAKLGGVVEFKKIPKLKNIKDNDPKFSYVYVYRMRQCCYIFHFTQEEEDVRRLIESQELTPGSEGVDLTYLTLQKRTRKNFRDSANHYINDLIVKSKSGIIKTVQNRKDKKKKKVKQRSKDPEENAKFLKAEVLAQIQDYISNIAEYKPKMDDQTMHAMIAMISINLFIPSAIKGYVQPVRVKAGSGRFVWDPLDIPSSSWAHRTIVYNIILHLILCYNSGNPPSSGELAAEEFRTAFNTYINESFVNHMVTALRSTDQLERETIQSCIKLLVEHCPHMTALVWRVIGQHLTAFSADGMWDTETASTQILTLLNLVEVLSCEKDEHFVSTTLLPLYKAPFEVIVRYHSVLFRLVTKLLSNNHKLIKVVILRLLKCWPVQSASKQLLFLEQLSAIFLEVVSRTGSAGPDANEIPPQEQWFYSEVDMNIFMSIHKRLFHRICAALEGEHYEVSVAAIRILDHPAVFFPFVLAPKVPEPATLPDGSLEIRYHPVLSQIYRSFRRVVATHDYVDVRKTINTLMGLLEDHWSDVCENEIIEEDKREVGRARRKEAMSAFVEKHGHYKARDPSPQKNGREESENKNDTGSSSDIKITLDLSSGSESDKLPAPNKITSPRHLSRNSLDDLDQLEHLSGTQDAVSNLVGGQKDKRQRSASISIHSSSNNKNPHQHSERLSKERFRRKSSLVPQPNRVRRKTEPATVLGKTQPPRKNSFELMLSKKKPPGGLPTTLEESKTQTSEIEDQEEDEDDDELTELDVDDISEETIQKIGRRQKSMHIHDFPSRLRTLSQDFS